MLLGSSLRGQDISQRDGPPRIDTPYILVATFHGSDRQLGIQAAAEIRRALEVEYSAKELFVVPASAIGDGLHGRFPVDSALRVADLAWLALQVRAGEMVDGSVTRTAAGIRLDARFVVGMGGEVIAQPLPAVAASNIGDAARGLVPELSSARKALPSFATCLIAARAGKYSDAIAEARQGIARYPDSPFDRICMLRALLAVKASPDSIIAVARAVVSIDSTSVFALNSLGKAYADKGDNASAAAIAQRLVPFGPPPGGFSAPDDRPPIDPARALPIIDSLLMQNPRDPSMLRTKWLLQLRAKQYAQALATGEELAKVDTSMVTLDYFQRMIGAAQSDGNAAAVQQLAARGAQKFPNEPAFPMVLAQSYRHSGQLQQALQAAERGAAINPKSTIVWRFAIDIANEMNQPDTVLSLGRQAVAGGASKDTISHDILGPASSAVKRAQDSGSRDDWMAALVLAQETDRIAASPRSKYFIAVAAAQIAGSIIDDAQTHAKSPEKADRATACTEARRASDFLGVARLALPSADGDSTTAGLLMRTQRYDKSIEPLEKRCGIVH